MPTPEQMKASLSAALKAEGVEVSDDWLDRCVDLQAANLGAGDRRQVIRKLEELVDELLPDRNGEGN